MYAERLLPLRPCSWRQSLGGVSDDGDVPEVGDGVLMASMSAHWAVHRLTGMMAWYAVMAAAAAPGRGCSKSGSTSTYTGLGTSRLMVSAGMSVGEAGGDDPSLADAQRHLGDLYVGAMTLDVVFGVG